MTVPAVDHHVLGTLARSPAARERPEDALSRNERGDIHDVIPGRLLAGGRVVVPGMAELDVGQQAGGGALLDGEDGLTLPALGLRRTESSEVPPGGAGVQSHSEKIIS